MPLETLQNKAPNIRRLATEIQERGQENLSEKYKALKNSGFFNKKEQEWSMMLDSNSFTGDQNAIVSDIIVQDLIDSKKAEQAMEKEKQRSDPYKEMILEGDRSNGPVFIFSCLLHILYRTKNDPQAAHEALAILRNGNYLPQHLEIAGYEFKDKTVREMGNGLENILLSIYIESQFDPNKAKEKYEILKKSIQFNKKDNLWKPELRKANVQWTNYTLTPQLMGVALEAVFDKKKAQKDLEALRKLYFKKDKGWQSEVSNSFEGSDDYYSKDQLLALWAEQAVSEEVLSQQDKPSPPPHKLEF